MSDYKLLNNSESIIRTTDGACIPSDDRNSDYRQYLRWRDGYTEEIRDPETGVIIETIQHPPHEPTPADVHIPTQQEIIASYSSALDAHYDDKAHEKHYDNRLTCALRAGYPGPFHAEGAAFASWMDTCNALAYQLLAEVLSGTRPIPSIDDVLTDLPELVWPE